MLTLYAVSVDEYPYSIPSDKFDIGLYSFHSHNTKPLSSFLDFDLAYNSNENYEVNNYGKGSFGNFTICNVLENKTKKLNKENHLQIKLLALYLNISNQLV